MAFVGGARRAPLYDRDRLAIGATIAGPAIVSQLDTTTLLLPGQSAVVHPQGGLIITDAGEL